MKIGFIGTGVMGQSMAGHLLKAGHELYVHNRTKSKADGLVSEGAIWCEKVTDVAKTVRLNLYYYWSTSRCRRGLFK